MQAPNIIFSDLGFFDIFEILIMPWVQICDYFIDQKKMLAFLFSTPSDQKGEHGDQKICLRFPNINIGYRLPYANMHSGKSNFANEIFTPIHVLVTLHWTIYDYFSGFQRDNAMWMDFTWVSHISYVEILWWS